MGLETNAMVAGHTIGHNPLTEIEPRLRGELAQWAAQWLARQPGCAPALAALLEQLLDSPLSLHATAALARVLAGLEDEARQAGPEALAATLATPSPVQFQSLEQALSWVDLRGYRMGYRSHCDESADRARLAEDSCAFCGHLGLELSAWHRDREEIAVAVCPACGHSEGF